MKRTRLVAGTACVLLVLCWTTQAREAAQQSQPVKPAAQVKPGAPKAAKTLLELPPALRAEFDRLVSGDDAGKRATAAMSLAEMGPEAAFAVPYLVSALGDRRGVIGPAVGFTEVRNVALSALKKIDEPVARELLLRSLKAQAPDLRGGAAWALGELRESRAVEPIVELLADSDSVVRAYAADALQAIGDPRTVELVIPVLKNLTYPRCEPAVSLLGRLKDQRAVEPLMERLREAEERGARVLADLQVVTGGKLELGSPSWSDLTRKRLKPEDAARFSALLRELSELDSGNLTITDNLRALIGPVSKSPQEWLDWWEQNKERFRKN